MQKGGNVNSRLFGYGGLNDSSQMLGIGKLSQQFLQQDLF